MGRWSAYMVELCYDGQWFNIDDWYRAANGEFEHRYLYAAPDRDILSSLYDELVYVKERINFSDLAPGTQDIICKKNPAYKRSSFDSWDFFIWGDLSDLEKLLEKPVEYEDDEYISKDLLKAIIFKVKEQIRFFRHTIPYREAEWPLETPIRIITCEP